MNKRAAIIIILSLFAAGIAVEANAQYGERQSLGLQGCSTTDLRYSPDGKNLFITCEAPKGVFWSTDHGAHWTYAGGGAYESGSPRALTVTQYGAFATGEGKLFAATFAGDGTFTPNWQVVQLIDNVDRITQSGKFVIGVGRKAIVLDSQTLTAAGAPVDVPGLGTGPEGNVEIVEASPTALYVLAASGPDPYAKKLYAAPFDSATGALGTFTDITNAPGLPAGYYFWNFRAHPLSGKLFVAVRNTHVQPWDLKIFVSTDGGASFVEKVVAAGGQYPDGFNFNDACFSSDPNTYLIGTHLTVNDGTNFTEANTLSMNATEGGQEGACAIDPLNPERAFVRTAVGVARTENLISASGSQTWTRTTSGLDGVTVYHMDRGAVNRNRALIATSAGFGFTDTFEAASPSWTFPVCANGDCAIFRSGKNVVIDPENENRLFAGGWDVQQGIVTQSESGPSINWQQFASRPALVPGAGIGVLHKSPLLPNILIVGWRWGNGSESPTNGVLHFYDAASRALLWTALPGVQVHSFIVLSPTLMFAAVGNENGADATAENRGIFRSADGGHTWTEMNGADVDPLLMVRDFSYDASRDVLYASTARPNSGNESGTVLRLESALNSGTTWRKPGPALPIEQGEGPADAAAVSVDQTTGNLFTGAGDTVYVSGDQGANWVPFFEGMKGEQMNVIDSGNDEESKTPAGVAKAAATAAAVTRVTQGSNVGLNALSPVSEFPACGITLTRACRSAVKKGTRCTVTSSTYDLFTRRGYARRSVRLEKSTNGRTNWKKVKASKTGAAGTFAVKEKISSSIYYRAVFTAPACRTAATKISVKRR